MDAYKKDVLDKALELVEDYHASDTSGHDVAHILRVVKMAKHLALANSQEVDIFVIELAALLHDIEDPKLNHPKGTVARFLEKTGVNESDQQHIFSIIEHMSYSHTKMGKRVATLEGKIVQDADRLDALGAIGIARAFTYGGSKKRPMDGQSPEATIAHFYDKLLKLEALMNTEEARRIAKVRTRYMKNFLMRFIAEKQITD